MGVLKAKSELGRRLSYTANKPNLFTLNYRITNIRALV